MNKSNLNNFVKKSLMAGVLMAGFLGFSQTLHAKTVDVSKIAGNMCEDLIPSDSNSQSSSSCVDALEKCKQQLSDHLVLGINKYNEWAPLNDQDLIQQEGALTYTTTSSVYNEEIQDYFITKHQRADITLGGQYGNTKFLVHVPFESPTFDKIKNNVKTGCQKVDTVKVFKTPELVLESVNSGGSDPAADPTQDPANDPTNGGGNLSGNNSPANPLEPQGNSTTNAITGGGCSMVSQSATGAWGNLFMLLPLVFASALRTRKSLGGLTKKISLKLLVLPCLMLAVACSGVSPNNVVVEEDDSQAAPTPVLPTPPTPVDPFTPAQATPMPPLQVGAATTNPWMQAIQPSAEDLLNAAFARHADFSGNLSSTNREKLIQSISQYWNTYLGDKDLESFQVALKENTLDTLNKFLQFETHTVLKAQEIYKSEGHQNDVFIYGLLMNLGNFNLSSLQHLQNALFYLPADGNGLELNLFACGTDVGYPDIDCDPKESALYNLNHEAMFLRIFLAQTADFYGIKDYFADPSGSGFEQLQNDFMVLPDDTQKRRLPDYVETSFSNAAIWKNCHYDNPSCASYKNDYWAGKLGMVQYLPELLKNLSFTYLDDQGKKHHWSYFNPENVYVNGQMFTLARGRFGAHEAKDVIFVKLSEID